MNLLKLQRQLSSRLQTLISTQTFLEQSEDFSAMPDMLAKHIVSPVKFTSELAEMEKAGYENFIELGPNKVLTGLVKKTLKGKNAVNIENNATMEKALASLN